MRHMQLLQGRRLMMKNFIFPHIFRPVVGGGATWNSSKTCQNYVLLQHKTENNVLAAEDSTSSVALPVSPDSRGDVLSRQYGMLQVPDNNHMPAPPASNPRSLPKAYRIPLRKTMSTNQNYSSAEATNSKPAKKYAINRTVKMKQQAINPCTQIISRQAKENEREQMSRRDKKGKTYIATAEDNKSGNKTAIIRKKSMATSKRKNNQSGSIEGFKNQNKESVAEGPVRSEESSWDQNGRAEESSRARKSTMQLSKSRREGRGYLTLIDSHKRQSSIGKPPSGPEIRRIKKTKSITIQGSIRSIKSMRNVPEQRIENETLFQYKTMNNIPRAQGRFKYSIVLQKTQKDQNTQSRARSKSKKKKVVHFQSKTSLDKIAAAQPTPPAPQITSGGNKSKIKSIRRILPRHNRGDVSLQDIMLQESRLFKKAEKPKIKKIRPSRAPQIYGDIYTELNYFHLKIDCSKTHDFDSDVVTNAPKPILCSVERASIEQQLTRRQHNLRDNQMIDFAVLLSRGYTLRQADLR